MCGIVGIMSSFLSGPEVGMFEDLLTVSNLRGSIGAGMIGVGKDETIWRHKTLYNGINLFQSKQYNTLTSLKPDQKLFCMIGHTRQPTKGGIDIDAVHPHDTPDIIGVHNGTMTNVNGKFLKHEESDSAAVFQALSDTAAKDFVNKSSGAFALVWVDKRDFTLHFMRNGQRPLWFAHIYGDIKNGGNGSTILWASERLMLEFILRRRSFHDETMRIEELPEDEHRVYDLTRIKNGHGPINVEEVESVKKVYTFHPSSTTAAGPYGHSTEDADYIASWENGSWTERHWPRVHSQQTTTTTPPSQAEALRFLKKPWTHPQFQRWASFGAARSGNEDHGDAVNIKQVGQMNKYVDWAVTFDDGAEAVFRGMPLCFNDYLVKKRREKIALDHAKAEEAKAKAAKSDVGQGVIPFRVTSQDSSNEAAQDCPLPSAQVVPVNEFTTLVEEALIARTKENMNAVVVYEGPVKPDDEYDDDLDFAEEDAEDDISTFQSNDHFAAAFDRARAQAEGLRTSKKEQRRIRARQREQQRLRPKLIPIEEFMDTHGFTVGEKPLVETKRNNYVSEDTFRAILAEGCANCSSTGVDPTSILFFSRKEFLCETCSYDDEARASAGLPPLAVSNT